MRVNSASAIYPRLVRRVRAVLIDSLIIILIMFAWWMILPLIENVDPIIKIAIPIVLVILIEPVMVSMTGGTPGHHIMGLRIQNAGNHQHLGLFRACIRTLLRGLLGWFTFIFALTSKKHQALHDLIIRSVVTLRKPDALPHTEKFSERQTPPDIQQAPAWRRALMILFYSILNFLVLTIISSQSVSSKCFVNNHCEGMEFLIMLAYSMTWLLMTGLIFVKCWQGDWFGCRNKPSVRN